MRLLNPPQYLAADAYLRFERSNLRHIEQLLGILLGKLIPQVISAHRDIPDATPLAIPYLEYAMDQLLCWKVAVTAQNAGVLVFDDRPALFQLLHRHQRAVQYIDRFKARDHNRHVIPSADGIVFAI